MDDLVGMVPPSVTFTVIIPVFNTQQYLDECLSSLAAQSFTDFEAIIVDDCSSDNSVAKIQLFCDNDDRFKLLQQDENKGQGAARNLGMEQASGKWTLFLDSDDYLDKSALEAIYQATLSEPQLNLILYLALNFDDDTRVTSFDSYFRLPDVTKNNWQSTSNVSPCTKAFLTQDLRQYNLTFPSGIKHEDEEFWFKYYISVDIKVSLCPQNLYYYRQRAGSTMTNPIYRMDLVIVLQNIVEYMQQQHMFEQNQPLFFDKFEIFLRSGVKNLPYHFKGQFLLELYNLMSKLAVKDDMLFGKYTTQLMKTSSFFNRFLVVLYFKKDKVVKSLTEKLTRLRDKLL